MMTNEERAWREQALSAWGNIGKELRGINAALETLIPAQSEPVEDVLERMPVAFIAKHFGLRDLLGNLTETIVTNTGADHDDAQNLAGALILWRAESEFADLAGRLAGARDGMVFDLLWFFGEAHYRGALRAAVEQTTGREWADLAWERHLNRFSEYQMTSVRNGGAEVTKAEGNMWVTAAIRETQRAIAKSEAAKWNSLP